MRFPARMEKEMKTVLIVFFSLFLGGILCGQSGTNDQPLVISTDSIMFFAISQEEYNDLKADDKWQVDEILGDCYSAFSQIKSRFANTGVRVFLSADKSVIFRISEGRSENFRRDLNEHPVGVALFHPSKKPLIHYGVFTPSDILDLIRGYHEEWFDRNEFIREIEEQIVELKNTESGGKFMKGKSDKDLEKVILFLLDPDEYFHDVKSIPDIFSYIGIYNQYLEQKRKTGCVFDSFLKEHFDVINDKKAEILVFLLMSADGEYGEEVADRCTIAFNSHPDVFIKVLRETDWHRVVNNLESGNWNEFKSGLAKLGNSEFERELKEYALAPRDEKGKRIVTK